jgi:DNA polymerase I
MSSANPSLGPDTRLLLVDGHSLAYRAFYALPVENFAAPDGSPTNAIHGFTSMLLQVIESEKPTHLAVAFDVSRETFRRAEFPEYKANRAKSPVEFKPQVDEIKQLLNAFGVVHLAVDGFEADDIIATLAVSAADQSAEVLILTGDRDALQLVNERITVLYPKRGVSDLARMTPPAVLEKFGVTPEQYADLAAMRGDTSDNLPSIPGVGDKTAASWLQTHGSLAEIIANADMLKGKVGESFRACVSQVELNRRLTELVKDVPLNVELPGLLLDKGDAAAIGNLFDRFGFKQLRPRAFRVFVDTSEVSIEVPINVAAPAVKTGFKPNELKVSLDGMNQGDVLGVAAGFVTGSILEVSVANSSSVLTISVDSLSKTDHGNLVEFLSDSEVKWVSHSAKPLIKWLFQSGAQNLGLIGDTELLQYLINPSLRGLDLETCVERTLHRSLTSANSNQSLFDEADLATAEQASAVAELWVELLKLVDPSTVDLLNNMELPLLLLISRMELLGIAVNLELLRELEAEFGAVMDAAAAEAQAISGSSFNLASPKQLQEILFVERGLPKTKKIKTGYTTDADALQNLFANTQDPVVAQILRWREVSKLRQTVNTLIPLVDSENRIHTTLSQTVAATGRLSSQEPNLQNIPVRTAEGRKIRSAFVSGNEYAALMTADYSQIEMRIMAHLSNDAGLIDAFNSGEDLHTTMASSVFGVAPDKVDPDMRRRIKAMSYGLAYGLGAFGLSQQLGISNGEASALMEKYLDRFGGMQDYLKRVVKEARINGYTETMFGRRRYLPDLQSDKPTVQAAAERMALNSPIQGSAADIIKMAMLNVARDIEKAGLQSRLLLQVHDELVLEIHGSEQEHLEAIVRAGMANAAELSVPLDVSVGIGANWDSAAH